MAYRQLIAKNNTGLTVKLTNLEATIAASGQVELLRGGLFTLPDLQKDYVLQSLVEDGTITLNDGTSDITYEEFYWVGVANHAHNATHVKNGDDELDGNLIQLGFTPSTYTRFAGGGDVTDLRAHLEGVDKQFAFIKAGDFQDTVKDKDLTVPPGSPTTGDRYIVAAGATGAWAGQDGKIAEWDGATWLFYVSELGWVTYIADEFELYSFNGSNWVPVHSPGTGPTVHAPAATNPGSAADGDIYYNTVADMYFYRDGGAWFSISTFAIKWNRQGTLNPSQYMDDGSMSLSDTRQTRLPFIAGTHGTAWRHRLKWFSFASDDSVQQELDVRIGASTAVSVDSVTPMTNYKVALDISVVSEEIAIRRAPGAVSSSGSRCTLHGSFEWLT